MNSTTAEATSTSPYWAEALSAQSDDASLKECFSPLAEALAENEERILGEINATQGAPVDLGGYYLPDEEKANAAMRPSKTFNGLLAATH